jgi:hypothetical protein
MMRLLTLAAVCALALAQFDVPEELAKLRETNALLNKRMETLQAKLGNGVSLAPGFD